MPRLTSLHRVVQAECSRVVALTPVWSTEPIGIAHLATLDSLRMLADDGAFDSDRLPAFTSTPAAGGAHVLIYPCSFANAGWAERS